MTFGTHTISLFEIDQPFCNKTYGTTTAAGTCAAVLGTTGAHKCYNTRKTCQDAANYDPGVRTLRFARSQGGLLKYGPLIPSIAEDGISTTPGMINLASMNKSGASLGAREAVTITFDDHQHSDHLVDKYRLERETGAASIPSAPFRPKKRGTFWGKWLSRNPYWVRYPCRLYEGAVGDAVEDMRVRHLVIDEIDGPTKGKVTLTARDAFAVIEARKAVAPLASTGELLADISDVDLAATLSPAGIGNEEYPASGHIAIGDEVIAFTRAGDVLTLTRGAFLTVPEEHKAEDLVQLVLTYSAELVQDIIYDLLVNYSEIPASSIPKTDWDLLAAELTQVYTAHITKPTPVINLIGELCRQAPCTVWPDVSTGQILFRALRPAAPSATVDDTRWIVKGTLKTKRDDAKRVSQAHVYYAQTKPNGDLEDARNFRSRYISPDLPAESAEQYGVPAIREEFSRWIAQGGRTAAQRISETLIAMFRDAPLEAEFEIHASRAGELNLAEPFTLRVSESQDFTGLIQDVLMVPVKLERGESRIKVSAQQVTFAGGGEGLDGNDRTVFLENDSFNLNLREIHDLNYAPPVAGDTVTFRGVAGFTIGSRFTNVPAMVTGDWPEGVTLILVTDGLRIQGKGGAGGNGRVIHSSAETAGADGGDAIEATVPISIDNTGGEIWGGGGGGGGGAAQTVPTVPIGYGGNGGGGAGTEPGLGGSATSSFSAGVGNPGTADAGGAGQAHGGPDGLYTDGGNGGGPGEAGATSAAASTGPSPSGGAPGGAAGRYIVGNSFVTWIANGDRRGGVA